MAMRMETVDILVEKAHFEPHVAVAIAQAMDVAMEEKMQDRQIVTVPVLTEAKSELVVKIERLGSELRAELEITATAIRAELESMGTTIRAELKAEIQASAAATKSDLLRHMYTAMATQLALLLGVSYFFVLHVK